MRRTRSKSQTTTTFAAEHPGAGEDLISEICTYVYTSTMAKDEIYFVHKKEGILLPVLFFYERSITCTGQNMHNKNIPCRGLLCHSLGRFSLGSIYMLIP